MKRALFESDASVYNKVRALKADARRGGVAEAGELTDFYSVTTVGEALVKTLNTLQRDGRLDTDTARMLMQNFNSVMVPTINEVTKIADSDPDMKRCKEAVVVEGKMEYFQNLRDAWKIELSDCTINTGYRKIEAKRARVLLNLKGAKDKDKAATT